MKTSIGVFIPLIITCASIEDQSIQPSDLIGTWQSSYQEPMPCTPGDTFSTHYSTYREYIFKNDSVVISTGNVFGEGCMVLPPPLGPTIFGTWQLTHDALIVYPYLSMPLNTSSRINYRLQKLPDDRIIITSEKNEDTCKKL